MILSINSNYLVKQHQPVDHSNGEELCFLCGTDLITKYYLDDLRFAVVMHVKQGVPGGTHKAYVRPAQIPVAGIHRNIMCLDRVSL
jgi:hypothetical protein